MMLVTANIFQPLIDVFQSILLFIHNHLAVSWGLSIVLLTVLVRALLIPLTVKQFHSMRKLQEVAPQLKVIQARYKDDKQRQQQEVMKFYKENEVNPFASCLPLVAQLPVFIGLFYTLRTSLRKDICPGKEAAYQAVHGHAATVACGPHTGASFLFIPDLTNKATGAVLVVLIILYVGTQLASSLMSATPNMDKTQRQIMLFMPLIFVIFVINFPAGLIVYWITTNTWTMGQQYVIRRRLGPVKPITPTGDGAVVNGGASEPAAPNGASSGGLGGLVRGLVKPAEVKEKETAGVASRSSSRARRETPPPPPPRKKKKRSGRRR